MNENGDNARFESDINNLDKSKYPKLYSLLEELFIAMLPGFETIWKYCNSVSFSEEYYDHESPNNQVEPLVKTPNLNASNGKPILKPKTIFKSKQKAAENEENVARNQSVMAQSVDKAQNLQGKCHF